MTADPFPAYPLSALGSRIVVMGPSNAGKSTLAYTIGRQTGINVIHLDQLRFMPNTDWELRSRSDFDALHAQAIAQDSWIIEGNYSALVPARLARATGVVLLDASVTRRFLRYLNRTLLTRKHRIGNLEGGQESLKWEMVTWILIKTRGSAARLETLIHASGKPYVFCKSARQLDQLYSAWGLERPR